MTRTSRGSSRPCRAVATASSRRSQLSRRKAHTNRHLRRSRRRRCCPRRRGAWSPPSHRWRLVMDGIGAASGSAPEQIRGEPADARTDLFACGLILHEALTGARPFQRATEAETLSAVLHDDPPPLTVGDAPAPPALGHAVARCLAEDPERRWQSARDLVDELRWIQGGDVAGAPMAGRRRRRSSWWVTTTLRRSRRMGVT